MLRIWKRRDASAEPGAALAESFLGESPWLVLGGGGIKGLAHLGAWRALGEAGFQPAGILGTSIGALVGACIAGGRDMDEMEARARALVPTDIAQMHRKVLWRTGLRSPSLYRGEVLRSFLEGVLPEEGWQALEVRFQANAVELGTGRTEWFGVGARTDVSLVDAVYASAALPLFFPPARLPGGHYVDGGAEDTLPIRRAAELGATGIVAVDTGSGETADGARIVDRGLLAIHQRVFSIMSGRTRRDAIATWNGPPLLYVRPDLDGYATFDFDHVGYFLEEGHRSVQRVVGSAAATRDGDRRAPVPPRPS